MQASVGLVGKRNLGHVKRSAKDLFIGPYLSMHVLIALGLLNKAVQL